MIFFAFSTASRLQASRAVPWQVANVTRHPTSPRFFFEANWGANICTILAETKQSPTENKVQT